MGNETNLNTRQNKHIFFGKGGIMKRLIVVVIIVFVLNPVLWAQPVYFADANLKAEVEAVLRVSNPTAADMLGLIYLWAPYSNIIDLKGLEYATNLETLYLYYNQISNLSPLSGLTNLRYLYLYYNQISNLSPLSGLTNLTYLYLSNNKISDLSPLSRLTNLENLSLGSNQISDLSPLSGLTNLKNLSLDVNQISDLPRLDGLTNLENLNLSHNRISSISALSGLTELWWLMLYNNKISDLSPLSGLTNLEDLRLQDNKISDISPLSGLTNLEELRLQDNKISDISPLSGLTNLVYLSLWSNQISDLPRLDGLTNLVYLSLWSNQISDISPLSGLTNLDSLGLGGNPLCQEACDVYIPLLESYGTSVYHDDCIECPTVPDVVGMVETVAKSAITSANLNVGAISNEYSDSVPQGFVISQSPSGGTIVSEGSDVNITISIGPQPGDVPPVPPDANCLVAHWKLDDGSGNTAIDSSGNGLDITLHNTTWEDGIFGSAAHFHGVGYGDVSDFNYIENAITLCAWVWHDEFIINKIERYVTVGQSIAAICKEYDGRLVFYIDTDDNLRHLLANDVLTEGQWHHVAGTWDGLTQRLYINGVQIARQMPGGVLVNASDVRISSTMDESFNGILDDVRIYNCAMSANDIRNLAGEQAHTNILANGGFKSGFLMPWNTYGDVTTGVVGELVGAEVPEAPIEGSSCLHVVVAEACANSWDAGLQHAGHVFEAGKKYTLSAFLKCKRGTLDINFKLELGENPWTGYGEQVFTMTEEWAEYSITTPVFTEEVSPATITFHIGFAAGDFWIDGVRFHKGDYVPPDLLN